VPLALCVSLAAGIASPLGAEQTMILVAGTVCGAVATPLLAIGVGSLFPRFGSVRMLKNRSAVMPSKTAFLVYTVTLVVTAVAGLIVYTDLGPVLLAGLLSLLLSAPPGVDLAVSASTATAIATATLLCGLVAPILSVWYAIRRFDSFTQS